MSSTQSSIQIREFTPTDNWTLSSPPPHIAVPDDAIVYAHPVKSESHQISHKIATTKFKNISPTDRQELVEHCIGSVIAEMQSVNSVYLTALTESSAWNWGSLTIELTDCTPTPGLYILYTAPPSETLHSLGSSRELLAINKFIRRVVTRFFDELKTADYGSESP